MAETKNSKVKFLKGWLIEQTFSSNISLRLVKINGTLNIGLDRITEDENKFEPIYLPLKLWESMVKRASPDLVAEAHRILAKHSKESRSSKTTPSK